MSITVSNRSFTTIFSANDSFLKMNENSKVSYSCDLVFSFDFEASSDYICQISSDNSLTLLNSTWGNHGFIIGDSIDLIIVVDDPSSFTKVITKTVTIDDITSDVLTFSPALVNGDITPTGDISEFLNVVFPSVAGVTFLIENNTRSAPESFEFYFNLIENTSQGSEFSLIDGEVNRFRFLAVDTMTTGDTINGVQLGDKSGGAIDAIPVLEKTADGYTLTFDFYNWVRYEQAQFNVIPSPYQQNNSLKPYARFEALSETNNPNAIIVETDNFQLGNAGFIGENYNQGVNNFTVTSVINTDDLGNPISGFDFGQANNFVIKVETNQTTITNDAILLIQHLPIEGYKNNARSFNQNTLSAYSISDAGTITDESFDRDGAELQITSSSVSVSTNEITYEVRLLPNSDYTDYFNNQEVGDRFFRITMQCQSDSSDDATVVLISEGQADIQPPIGQEAGEVDDVDFYNHGMELGVDSPINGSVYALTEDDILCHSVINFNKADNYDAFRVLFQVVNDSTGQFFNLFSRTINLNQYPDQPNGVKLINYNENLGYQLPNPERNVLSLEFNGNETSTTYEVELLHTLLLSWRYWQAKPQALADFLDANLPNNGLNDEWVRYATAGFSFRFRLELIKDGIADFFNCSPTIIEDYDTQNVTTVITFEDLAGNSIPAPLNNQQFKVIATHTAPTNWDISDLWAWIAERPLENEPRRMNSTAWAYTTANLPLVPEQGETQSTVTVSGSVATVVTLCEGSQLPNDVTFVARIESPIIQECQSPLSVYFKGLSKVGATESERLTQLINDIRDGVVYDSGANLCCPECEINDVPDTGYAFGRNSLLTTLTWLEPCCENQFATPDTNCTATYTADVQDFIDNDITGASLPITSVNPSEYNRYNGTSFDQLAQGLINAFSDPVVRYNAFVHIIGVGLTIICSGSELEIKQIQE